MRLVISCFFLLALALPIMGFANEDLRRGQALLKDGQYSDAIEALQAGVKRSPNDAKGRIDLARAQYEAGQLDDASKSLREAKRVATKAADREALAGLEKRVGLASRPVASSQSLTTPSSQKQKKSDKELIDCDGCPPLVVIPAGTFMMGSPADEAGRFDDEGPFRVTFAKPFAIGKFEVTRAQWELCVQANVCRTLSEVDEEGKKLVPLWQTQFDIELAWPVEVSRVDAIDYVRFLSAKTKRRYRLPSEAEWEYAARAGTEGPFYWKGEQNEICLYENVLDLAGSRDLRRRRAPISNPFYKEPPPFECIDGFSGRAPVGSFKPNPWGLYDVIGNVTEWVADCGASRTRGYFMLNAVPSDGSAINADDCGIWQYKGGSLLSSLETPLRLALRGIAIQGLDSEMLKLVRRGKPVRISIGIGIRVVREMD